jgi:hypothetical protein
MVQGSPLSHLERLVFSSFRPSFFEYFSWRHVGFCRQRWVSPASGNHKKLIKRRR